jgi:S1-C subfamily serine protease
MLKFYIAILSLILSGGCAHISFSPQVGWEYDNVLKVTCKETNQRATAFVIGDDGLLLAVYHVMEGVDDPDIRVSTRNRTYRAHVVFMDKINDFVILKTDLTFMKPYRPSTKGVREGEVLRVLSRPSLYRDVEVLDGIVTYVGRFNVYLDRDFPKGFSGSPVLDSENKLVGIAIKNIREVGGESNMVVLRVHAIDFIMMGGDI